MEKISFHHGRKIVRHHGGTIFSTRWNDLIVAYKYTNRKEEKQENSHKKHIFTLEMKHIKNTHQTHFRVMKKIYPQKWLELHPYKQTNSVDQYYVGIANEIHKRLYSSTIADAFEEEENIRYTSLCLAAWFEDVISPDRHLAGIHCRVPEAIRSLSALLPHQRRLFSG